MTIQTLKVNKEFNTLYKKGARKHSSLLILFFLHKKGYQAGFTVSKKVGGAVVRNRVRRQLKEIYRKYASNLKEGTLVFVAKAPIAQSSFEQIQKDFIALSKSMGMMKSLPS